MAKGVANLLVVLVLVHQSKHALVDWAGRHLRIELDLAKRLLIVGDVLR